MIIIRFTLTLIIAVFWVVFAFGQRGHNTVVKLNAFKAGTFTKIAIDTSIIKLLSSKDVQLTEPDDFVRKLNRALTNRDTVPLSLFNNNKVRMAFMVRESSDKSYNIFISTQKYLLLGKRVYKLDNGLKRVIRRHIPEPDGYLPILPKRLLKAGK